MTPMGWYGPIVIDLKGVKVPSQHRPALHVHDHASIVGHTTGVTVGSDGILVKGVFSGETQHVEKVTVPARNGFQWQMSVGANPLKTERLEPGAEEEVNGRTVVGPLTISRLTELGEISFVPLGADGDTSVDVAATRGGKMNPVKQSLKAFMAAALAEGRKVEYTDAEIEKMEADEARRALKRLMRHTAEADDEDEEEEDEAEAGKSAILNFKREMAEYTKSLRVDAAKELNRQKSITTITAKYGVKEITLDGKQVDLAAHAIAENWDESKTELHALRAERPAAGVGIPGGLGYAVNPPQMSEAVFEAAVLQAARHQMLLENDSFYHETFQGHTFRRVPEHIERQTKQEFKSRYTDQVQQAAHTVFKGRVGLHQLFTYMLRANGHRGEVELKSEGGIRSFMATWDSMDRQTIRAEGASNLSISNILANVLNKFALQGYLFVEQAWREIAGIRAVNDFKPTKSINLLGDVMYKILGPAGELDNASFSDQAFSNLAIPFGRIATIPWVHLVNDDLGMLTQIPLKIGQGAGLALNDFFWSLWASLASGSAVGTQNSNPNFSANGDDGNAFWRTTSSSTMGSAYNANKTSGAGSALSATSLLTVKKLFDNQIDPNKNPLGFDGAQPILLFGPSNWKVATELMTAEYIIMAGLASTSAASYQMNRNVWQGFAKPVMSRYIDNASYVNSTTAFWMLFNPAALPVIEVAFLNGVDTPAVLQASPDFQFDKLGISIRGTMPFGVNQQNFRGGVYSVGA